MTLLSVHPETIPAMLRVRPYVLWAAEPDPQGGKDHKVPRRIANPAQRASSTDCETWGTFEDACEAFFALTADPRWAPLRIAGIGVVLLGDGLICLDLDGAVTPGGLTPAAAQIVRAVPTFTEVSPSSGGLHLWIRGQLLRAVVGRTLEAYAWGRFVAVTGQRYPGTPPDVEPAPRLLTILDEISRPAPVRPVPPMEGTDISRHLPAKAPRVRRQTPILQGTRDNSLFRIAARLVAEGAQGPALLAALREANARLCQPPLAETDVQRIARSASRRA
jgi:Primase C terminal 1 (PriCT-1)